MPPRPSSSPLDNQGRGTDAQQVDQQQKTEAETTAAPAASSSAVDSGGVSVENYLLPRTLTQRLAKGVLPPNTQIQRDAVLAITKAATVFVSYLSSHANEATLKKTVTPEDVLSAISELEFDNFLPRLQAELAVHAEAAAGKRKAQRQRVKARESRAAANAEGAGKDNEEGDAGERDTKRLKRDGDNEAVISDGGSGSGKESQGRGSTVEVVIPGGQSRAETREDDGVEDEEEDGTEEHEDEEEEDEGDEEEESSEQEEGEEEEGDTDADERHPLQPDMDSELESASDKADDPDDMDSQAS